ncbi:MAG TPA: VCBS repeat-containing protein [Tabrizicola sp.]|nr:VCBS repeat-containing protein [Tabrizicola sp.]
MRLAGAVLLALLPTAALADTIDHVETRADAPDGWDHDRPAWPVWAQLSHPTDRYDHDVLGGLPPWEVLEVGAVSCGACRHGSENTWVRLPKELVFEDVAPRLWDVTGDGRPEIVVVESHIAKGARLAVWSYADIGGDLTRLATTPFIGQPHRWLAPAGIADFDGDGRVEVAYVDRPHLQAELVFVRLEGDRLVETLRLPGLTNHRIGEMTISGGQRDCGAGPELVLASKDWTRVMRVRGGQVAELGPMPPDGLRVPPC